MTVAAPTLPLARVPDALDRLGERIGERANPIIVKEIRQGLRTRTFWVFFSLMLIACVIISLVAVATTDGWPTKGKAYFFAYDICLGLVQFFVIPYSAYRSMAREREDETWVLLTLTGLGPRRILRGKMGSFMLQGVLYTSAAAPFLLFSYYLNGIDLPSILVVLLAGVAWQLLLTSIAVSIATLATSRLMRGVLHFVTLGMLFQGTWLGLVSTFGALEGIRDLLSSSTARITTLGVVFMLASWGVLLYESAAARMSLVTESYARGPRIALLVQLLGMMGMFVWGAIDAQEIKLAAAGSIVCSAHLLVVGTFIASDQDGMARALWLKRRRGSLLEPGALRGFRLVMLLFAAIALVFGALIALGVGEPRSFLDYPAAPVLAAPAYGALYLATPIVLARLGTADPEHTPRVTRIAALGLLIVGSGAPPLFAALAGGDAEGVWINFLNPVMGLVNLRKDWTSQVPHLLGLWLIALVFVLIAQDMLRRRDNAFRDQGRIG